jgi:chromosomal replication initiator protein
VEALLGRDRSQKIAEPRQVAMYLLRSETNASLPQIGAVLGGRDHTTVMYAIQKITNDIENEKKDDMRRKVKRVKEQLYGQSGVAA